MTNSASVGRYGVMEKLLLLQSQVTKNKEYYLNKSVLEAGISPVVLFPQASSLGNAVHFHFSILR